MAKQHNQIDINKMLESNLSKPSKVLDKVAPDYTLIRPGDQTKNFDYIEKWTGQKSFLNTPADAINQNFINAQYNEAKQKSQDQSNWKEFGGFLTQAVVGEIVLGTVSGFGYLLDVHHWGDKLMGGEGDWGNWLSDYMEEGQSWIREAAPIYQDPDNAGRSTFENMLHGDGWWAENGVSIASSLSILIPVAGWARGVSLAGKGLNYASQGARLGKYGSAAVKGTKTVDKVVDAVHGTGKALNLTGDGAKAAFQGIHKATVSRLIESQMEATAVFKEKYEYYLEEENMSDEEARKAAGAAASFTYNWNWGAMVTDIPQYMLLGRSGRALKAGLTTKMPGFIQNSKLLNKTKGIRGVGTTMFSEGVEEAYQYIVSEEGKRMGDIQAGLVDANDTSLGERLGKYNEESELWTSALFGALGGGVFKAAGPMTTQLMNKALRKGEARITEKDLRVNEAKDRYTRLAHSMDMINQATESGDEEAIFAAKSNMAFDMAKEAVLVNNWTQAREAMAQLKNATPEEQEAYQIKENYGEFIENTDEWIAHMDKAAEMVDKAKGKYTYGLAEQVAKRQFEKYMYDTQAPKLRNKISEEKKSVIPNYDSVSKDGDTAIDFKLEGLAMEKAISNLEALIKQGKMPASEVDKLKAQVEEGKAYIADRKASFKEFEDSDALSKHDKLALAAIEGGTADDLVKLGAKQKLMDFQNEKNIEELNYLTSREGLREFKQMRALKYEAEKLATKKEKDKANKQAAAKEAVSPNIPTSNETSQKKPFDELNIAEISKAIKNGAKYGEFVTEDKLEALKVAVADYNARLQQNPNMAMEEALDDVEIQDTDQITLNEEVEDSTENVLDDTPTGDTTDLNVDTATDLQAELEAAESHDEIEVPLNDREGAEWTITNTNEDTRLSSIPGQLAWLSANNPEAKEVTPEMKAQAAFLETPGSSVTALEVRFDFNREYIAALKAAKKDTTVIDRIMASLSKGIMPDGIDIGFMPMTATFLEDGKPVVFQGFEMKMSLHDPSFFFKKNGDPKYPGVSEYQAKLAYLHKKAIVSQMLNGGTVIAPVVGKSRGKINAETNEDGSWVQNFVAKALKTPLNRIKFLVGNKQGNYMTAGKTPRLLLGSRATPGAIYTEVSTANGSKFPLRLQVDKLSVSEATIIHALYIDLLENPNLIESTVSAGVVDYINNSTDPRIAGIKSYLPNFADMTYQEMLSHLVYEGSRTMAHPETALTYFVNTEKGGVQLANAVQFGKTKMDVSRLSSEKGKAEFIDWVSNNKRRQVDAGKLEDTMYKMYLNDNKILSTNVKTTPEGNIFVQPVISYGTNMRVVNADGTEAKKTTPVATSTKEQAILDLKESLAFELENEFGNMEEAKKLQEEIDKLELVELSTPELIGVEAEDDGRLVPVYKAEDTQQTSEAEQVASFVGQEVMFEGASFTLKAEGDHYILESDTTILELIATGTTSLESLGLTTRAAMVETRDQIGKYNVEEVSEDKATVNGQEYTVITDAKGMITGVSPINRPSQVIKSPKLLVAIEIVRNRLDIVSVNEEVDETTLDAIIADTTITGDMALIHIEAAYNKNWTEEVESGLAKLYSQKGKLTNKEAHHIDLWLEGANSDILDLRDSIPADVFENAIDNLEIISNLLNNVNYKRNEQIIKNTGSNVIAESKDGSEKLPKQQEVKKEDKPRKVIPTVPATPKVTKTNKPKSTPQGAYTFVDFANENKGKEVSVTFEKYKTPFKATITGEVEVQMTSVEDGKTIEYVGVQIKTSNGKLLTANPFFEIKGDVSGIDKLQNDSNKIEKISVAQQSSGGVKAPLAGVSDEAIAEMPIESYNELVKTGYTQWLNKDGEAEDAAYSPTQQSSNTVAAKKVNVTNVASTIKMFQSGIKTEDNEEIQVNLPESNELEDNPC